MSITQDKPRTSGSVDAVEGSLYANLKQADQVIVSKAVDSYLKNAKEEGAEYEARVQSLRNLFSTDAKLKELKSQGNASYLSGIPYSPGYARSR